MDSGYVIGRNTFNIYSMHKGDVLFEGYSKVVYATEDERKVIIHFKDTATAFHNIKKATLVNKGIFDNKISSILFGELRKAGIDSHFIEMIGESEQVCRKVSVLPLRVVVRNVASGSIVNKLGLKEGMKFVSPIFEMNYKNESLDNPMLNAHHAVALGIASFEELKKISDISLRVNEVLINLFLKIDISLIDFKLEFGRTSDGEILLADEISPDTCRFWDIKSGKRMDKDRFRRDMGDVMQAYEEIYSRLMTLK